MNITRESISQVESVLFRIRVWHDRALNESNGRSEMRAQVRSILADGEKDELVVATRILKLDTVAAVEVLHQDTREGTVLYKNWP